MEINLAGSKSPRQIHRGNSPIHRAKFPLNYPMDRARDSLIGNPKSEIAAPDSIEFSNGSRAIACDSEIRIPKSPRRIQLNSPRELAVVRPPSEFYAEIGGCSGPPSIKVAWYLQLALTVIIALRGWSVSALVAQKSEGAFNWT